MDDAADKFIEMFRKMKRAQSGGLRAPHKPVLLVSVSNLIERGIITENKIPLDDKLVKEFKELWNTLVVGEISPPSDNISKELDLDNVKKYPFTCSIEMPYFHLQSEPFWELEKSENWEAKKSYYSINVLRKNYPYAKIHDELYELLQNKESRQRLTNYLLSMI